MARRTGPDPDTEAHGRRNPRPVPPDRDLGLRANPAPQRSLVEELGEVADDLRQLNTDLGMRPYRVFSVLVEWSGTARGRGKPTTVREVELLPTPLVDFRPLGKASTSGGKTDRGTARLREISPRYTEEDIESLFRQPAGASSETFLEVRYDARGGRDPVRRRFVVKDVPHHEAENFQWVCTIVAQDQPRRRDGTVRDVRR